MEKDPNGNCRDEKYSHKWQTLWLGLKKINTVGKKNQWTWWHSNIYYILSKVKLRKQSVWK